MSVALTVETDADLVDLGSAVQTEVLEAINDATREADADPTAPTRVTVTVGRRGRFGAAGGRQRGSPSMTGRVLARCPRCQSDGIRLAESEAEDAVADHNEKMHDGEPVAEIVDDE